MCLREAVNELIVARSLDALSRVPTLADRFPTVPVNRRMRRQQNGPGSFVQRLIALQVLPVTQPVVYAPWSIRPKDLETVPVQQAVAAAQSGGRAFRERRPQTS